MYFILICKEKRITGIDLIEIIIFLTNKECS